MIKYRNSLGQLHRDNGLPAVEFPNGDREWWVNGKLHRDNGLPAIEFPNGDIEWRVNGLLHRDNDLPAVESYDKEWWVNGKRHRNNGEPAIIRSHGTKEWWVNGKRHRDGDCPAIETSEYDWSFNGHGLMWYINDQRHREVGLPAVDYFINPFDPNSIGIKEWWVNGRQLSKEKGIAYFNFCQKMKDRTRIRAQKKIYFWWIQICYDMSRKCGQRMAQYNLNSYEQLIRSCN